jgi:hypothetical protein
VVVAEHWSLEKNLFTRSSCLPFELAILQFWGGKGGKREKKEKKEKKKTLVGLSGVCCATRCCVRCAPLS